MGKIYKAVCGYLSQRSLCCDFFRSIFHESQLCYWPCSLERAQVDVSKHVADISNRMSKMHLRFLRMPVFYFQISKHYYYPQFQSKYLGFKAGEMVLRLGALASSEDTGLVSVPKWQVTIVHNSSYKGSSHILIQKACVWCTYTHANKHLST